MKIELENVTVTSWSRQPLLRLSAHDRRKLAKAIRFSREIVADSIDLLSKYETAKIVAAADARMATDYFGTHDIVREALAKYFGLALGAPGAPRVFGPNLPGAMPVMAVSADEAKVASILAKFKLINAGIKGKFDIVVGGIHDADDIKTGLKDALRDPRHAWRHLKFITTGTEGWVNPSGKLQRIHLNTDAVKNYSEGKIARVIVHEASHKFADTDDVSLLGDGSDDGTGYKWDDLKFNQKNYVGLDNNANSYAWGGRLMWKRKRRHPAGI